MGKSACCNGIAVVGAGVINPVSTGINDFVSALNIAKSNLGKLEGAVPRGKSAVGLVLNSEFDGPDKAFTMSKAAIAEAIAGCELDLASMDGVAVILATMAGGSYSAEKCYPNLLSGLESADDSIMENSESVSGFSNGVLARRLCKNFGIVGPSMVVSNACASGNIAIGLALDFLRSHKYKAVIVVGVEVIKPTMVWGAERSGFIGTKLTPFHPDRDGAILGEGAAAMVLVNSDLAMGRKVLGWIDGFGSVCDRGAAAITLAEDGSGLYRAMLLALIDAGRNAEELIYVNAHAPGTRMIDAIECSAVARLVHNNANFSINSTKSITSHLSGASAITEVIATLLQMRDSFIHGNAGLDCFDSSLALTPVGANTISRQFSFGLSNACGGGGLNTSIAVSADRDHLADYIETTLFEDDALVISGCGLVADENFCWVSQGQSSFRPSAQLVDFNIYQRYPIESNYHYMNRAAQLAASAAAEALEMAGIEPAVLPYPDDQFAVIFGTCLGGAPQASKVLCDGMLHNPNAITPSMALDHGVHLGAALVCRHYGLTGTTYTITGSRRSGLQALEVAAMTIHSKRAEAALVAGFDSHDTFEADLLKRLFRCSEPADAAGAIVLEKASRAEARSASIKARLIDICTLSGQEMLQNKLGSYLNSHRWDNLYLATHDVYEYETLIKQALVIAGRTSEYFTIGEDSPDPRAGLGLMAIIDSIRRGAPSVIVAPSGNNTAIVVNIVPVMTGDPL